MESFSFAYLYYNRNFSPIQARKYNAKTVMNQCRFFVIMPVMHEKHQLFQPVSIQSLSLENRFVRSATHDFMADREGFVTTRQVDLFKNLAAGGIGLIITGHAYVHPSGQASLFQLGAGDDLYIKGLRRIATAVHAYPSRIFLQISHAGRQTKPKLCGCQPLAPSPVYDPVFKVTPCEMTSQDIEETILNFIHAGLRAQKAGFDGIQLHLAHGYLLSSFISPHTNRRKDRWGGSLSKRLRIVTAIIRGLKSTAGKDFPVTVKLNSTDFLAGGLQPEESVEISKFLEEEGISAIEVSGGMSEAGKGSVQEGPFTKQQEGYFIENAARIKAAVSIPVMGLGGIRTLSVMQSIIAEEKADLISMCRPFIHDPHFIHHLKSQEIRRSGCISCNKCFNPRGINCVQRKQT